MNAPVVVRQTSTRVARVEELYRAGLLSALDRHLARTFAELCPEASEDVLLAAALVSRAVARGHVCLDLDAMPPLVPFEGQTEAPVNPTLPSMPDLTRALTESPLVATREDPFRPLVLDGTRLYLGRYADYEDRLVQNLLARTRQRPNVDMVRLGESLARLFPALPGSAPAPNTAPDSNALDATNLQRVATVLAVRSSLSVISGGPGTGKTTTVVKILAALQEQSGALRLQLLAPTGKAASRLAEAIRSGLERLDTTDEIRRNVPKEASTIHRALGSIRGSSSRFHHGPDHPLAADVVLVDEASMVDISLLTKLVEAIPLTARLILLGDKDQLASVEAGAILGDLYNAERHARYSPPFIAELERLTGDRLPKGTHATSAKDGGAEAERTALLDCTVQLLNSFRYGAESGIGRAARAINSGDGAAAERVLGASSDTTLERLSCSDREYPTAALASARKHARDWLRAYSQSATPEAALSSLSKFRVLCVHREGPLGVGAANDALEAELAAHSLLAPDAGWYHLRPIMVTANDYQLGVFNGDVGVIFRAEDGSCWAYFHGPNGLVRHLPARLPAHETVFAMTIHKSQGSEFEHVTCLFPSRDTPILSRELVYTALTRATTRVSVITRPDMLPLAAARRIHRASGLREKLWGKA